MNGNVEYVATNFSRKRSGFQSHQVAGRDPERSVVLFSRVTLEGGNAALGAVRFLECFPA
jgi:hypothetical protein